MIGAATIRALVAKGLSATDIADIAEAMERDAALMRSVPVADDVPQWKINKRERDRERKRLLKQQSISDQIGDCISETGEIANPIGENTPVANAVANPIGETSAEPPLSRPPNDLISNPPTHTPEKTPRARKDRAKPKLELPDGWKPEPFGLGTDCRGIVDNWPPGEAERQVERFTAHHTANGNRMADWQAAWKTWVLNSQRFGNRHGQRTGPSDDRNEIRDPVVRAGIAFERDYQARQRGLDF